MKSLETDEITFQHSIVLGLLSLTEEGVEYMMEANACEEILKGVEI